MNNGLREKNTQEICIDQWKKKKKKETTPPPFFALLKEREKEKGGVDLQKTSLVAVVVFFFHSFNSFSSDIRKALIYYVGDRFSHMLCSFLLLLSLVYRIYIYVYIQKKKKEKDEDIFKVIMSVLRKIYQTRTRQRTPSVYT
jgi:hypothetical protein